MIDTRQLQLELAEARKDIRTLWALLYKQKEGGAGTLETVTLTLFDGTGGSATADANFRYTFTTADNVLHEGVAPSHQRLRAAKKGLIGFWDIVRVQLVWTDEVPDAGACS
jgi:hypothetical protein